MLRRWAPVLGALLVALVTIGVAAWHRPVELYQETAFILDTYIRFQVDGKDPAGAVAAAKAAMSRTEKLLIRYDPGSDAARLNAADEWVAVSPLTLQALALARTWGERTNGAFDISLGRAFDLYDFGGGGRVPSHAEVSSAMASSGPSTWEIDEAAGRARRLIPAVIMDLGGIHKGLAVDLAGAELRRRGVRTALVDASGNMLALGPRPDGKPWRIGIQHPRQPGEIIAVVPLAGGQAISTSGDYQQYFERDGVRYHHILDPRTGHPARAGAISVTVLAPTAAQADLLSTALFVLGPDEGLKVLESLPGVEAVFVTDQLEVISSPGLRARLEVR